MEEKRMEELERKLTEAGKEILRIVGDDLPPDGYISIHAWQDRILMVIHPDWQDKSREKVEFYTVLEECT